MNPVDVRRTLLKCCTGLALVTLLAACGSDSSTPAAVNTPAPPAPPAPPQTVPLTNVSFSTTIQPIFNSHCIGCHSIGGTAGDILVLNTGTYNNLVNRPSDAAGPNPTGILVIPGNSASSILFQRVSKQGLPIDLLQMPLGGPFLSADDQTRIKNWIDEGAKNN